MPTRPPVHQPVGTLSREESERRRKALFNQRRPPTSAIYDADWKRCSRLFRERHPICSTPGCGARTQEADHVVSPKDRPDLRLRWSNLRPYCKSCHSRRTATDQSFGRGGR
jgi:5-methylcytosine-specific restriction protein A